MKISLLSNYPERRRQFFEARGASPLMRERRSNSYYDALFWVIVASRQTDISRKTRIEKEL